MAVKATIETMYGESRECYIRVNSIEVSNHGQPARALFRGFISQSAFQEGAHYVWEESIDFEACVSEALWPQAYAALADQEGFEDSTEV